MSKHLLLAIAFVLACGVAAGQNIRGHYVSKANDDGTIYHLLPVTLFESRTLGDLTFDLTYKEHQDGRAVLNFTYMAPAPLPADSVRFVSGPTTLGGTVEKFYIEADKKLWKHRYSLKADAALLRAFFDEEFTPQVTLYSEGTPYPYQAKRSAWRSYAPIGRKILEMIRVNESR